jgi:hypothetical protein
VRLETTDFTTSVHFSLLCREADAQRVTEELARVTDGRARCLTADELYAAWETPAEGEA